LLTRAIDSHLFVFVLSLSLCFSRSFAFFLSFGGSHHQAVGNDLTVLESVLEADVERAALVKEEKMLTEASKNGDASADARLVAVYAKLVEIEADKAQARAAAILSGLGFPPAAQERPTKEFSGGWRMRTALAR
jgi:ATP-binding cassette subfamily F protein 3